MQADTVVGGRYRLVERVGSGAFGVVWRAEEIVKGEVPKDAEA